MENKSEKFKKKIRISDFIVVIISENNRRMYKDKNI